MNLYGVIAIAIIGVVVVEYLGLTPAIQQILFGVADLVTKLADIPGFSSKGSKPHLIELAILFAYLIALVGIVRLILNRSRKDD